MKRTIQPVLQALLDRVTVDSLVAAPYAAGERRVIDPLHAALIPDLVLRAAHFEQQFKSAFGSVWQELAVVAAADGLGFAAQDHSIRGVVKEGRLRRIAEVLNRLEYLHRDESRAWPNWDEELHYIRQGRGNDIPVIVTCDVYAESVATGDRYAFELGAPSPNSNRTRTSKEKLLKLHCMEPAQVTGAYFALPYNPSGTREAYARSFSSRLFDLRRDAVVLIGGEFWDKIGGRATYREFISALNEIGGEYKERIYREYLRIEPPRPLTDNDR